MFSEAHCMKVCSFDVGMKNLAFAVTDGEQILDWQLVALDPKTPGGICVALVHALDGHPVLQTCDVALIEKQPSRNNKMRVIEALIQSYFVIRCIAIENPTMKKAVVYSSKHKLGRDTFKGSGGYRERKKLGVTRCACFLEETQQNQRFVKLFNSSKKKDDLADSLLQALSYTNSNVFQNVSSKQLDTVCKVNPRKPTERQHQRLYSKSNLKWLFHQNCKSSDEIAHYVSLNPKVKKAIDRWYGGSTDQAIRELI